jgi:N,N'-diacetyllegionaminate synthase
MSTEIIAEIGSVHDGSFGNALKLIELAVECGADSVKFQTHIAEAETLINAPAPSFFKGEPRFDYFIRTGFSIKQWKELKNKCDELKIEFLSSPFSNEAVEMLEEIKMNRYKIPSGEVTNLPMLELIAQTDKPIILSSGMSTWKELDEAVRIIQTFHNKITILQCTSEYPCAFENVGLNIMLEMRDRYNLAIGLSDHTLSNYSAFSAVSLGATLIEKHLTFSRKMYGSDARHSLEPTEFKDLVKGVDAIEKMLLSKVDKDLVANQMKEMKEVFQKSIVAACDIPEGQILGMEHLAFKKPGTGVPANRYKDILGRKTLSKIIKDEYLDIKDIV